MRSRDRARSLSWSRERSSSVGENGANGCTTGYMGHILELSGGDAGRESDNGGGVIARGVGTLEGLGEASGDVGPGESDWSLGKKWLPALFCAACAPESDGVGYVATSRSSDCRKLGGSTSCDLSEGRGEAAASTAGPARPAVEDSATTSAGRTARVRGRFSLRSGSAGWGSAGEAGVDLRFLRFAGGPPDCTSLALSKAFHALSSSCDSGLGGSSVAR